MPIFARMWLQRESGEKSNFPNGAGQNTCLLPVDFCFPRENLLEALWAHHSLRDEQRKFLLGSFLEEGAKGRFRAKHPEARAGPAGHMGLGRHPPPFSFLHRCEERDFRPGKPKLLLCSSAPPPQICSPSVVMQAPLCKCSSRPARRGGKACFPSPARVTSGCPNPRGRVTSAPSALISSMADLWEDGGSKAVPGEGCRARGNAVPFCP